MNESESRNYALQQYNQAVRYTRDLLAEGSNDSDDKVNKGLVACYENFSGNYKNAQIHLQSGLRIIAKAYAKQQTSTIREDVCQVFQRLDLQAMSFADSMAPYPYYLSTEPPKFGPPAQVPSSLESAITNFLYIFRWIFRAGTAWEPNPIPSEEPSFAYDALRKLDAHINISLIATHSRPIDDSRRRLALLKIYQITAGIITATGVYGQENFHKHLSSYEQIITLPEKMFEGNNSSSGCQHNPFSRST